jgi:hypothetical protein
MKFFLLLFFVKIEHVDVPISLFRDELYVCDNNDKCFRFLIVRVYCGDSFEYYISKSLSHI